MKVLVDCLTGFGLALVFALAFTPLVRMFLIRAGMVDKPDKRRINKVPIPRGGGVAVYLAATLALSFVLAYSHTVATADYVLKLLALATATMLIGLADDRWSLPPKLKLLGQLVVAFLVWFWAGLGFSSLWPELPAWLDCALTVFWITGAINAFNLIDGLDGLASGLAFIATVGMGGALLVVGRTDMIIVHCVFAGALLGFLRYNYNPASIFLGDSGSMFIGFVISVLPLTTHTPNSFLVSVGVPLLAMGVPIFDTSLAILRRSIRRLLNREEGQEDPDREKQGKVMTADTDHLHHRILRSVGMSQRKAAWTLYAFAIFLVVVGLVGMALESRAGGLYLAALAVVAIVIFKDISRVELFDAGRLLGEVAHEQDAHARRRWARLTVPFYVVADLGLASLAFLLVRFSFWHDTVYLGEQDWLTLVIRVTSLFVFLVLFKTYRTIWARALPSNFMRLGVACALGSVLGSVLLYINSTTSTAMLLAFTLSYATVTAVLLMMLRIFRGFVRDVFYAIDSAQLVGRKNVRRVLVYGSGLRYRSFRRELVRHTASNNRIIVGLLDDDILLRNHYIGGHRVMGTLLQAAEVINAVNADEVVLACEMTPEWLDVVLKTLKPTGVKITHFRFVEETL